MGFNCLNTCCFPLAQPCSSLLMQNIVWRQRTRVWAVLSASLGTDAEDPERSSFQQGGSCWAWRTTPWDSWCVLRGQQGCVLPPHLLCGPQSRCVDWAKPKFSKQANPMKSESKWTVGHLCFCKMKVALCNTTTSCHAPAEDLSPVDALWYLARTLEGTMRDEEQRASSNPRVCTSAATLSASLAETWPLQPGLLIYSPNYQQ